MDFRHNAHVCRTFVVTHASDECKGPITAPVTPLGTHLQHAVLHHAAHVLHAHVGRVPADAPTGPGLPHLQGVGARVQ